MLVRNSADTEKPQARELFSGFTFVDLKSDGIPQRDNRSNAADDSQQVH